MGRDSSRRLRLCTRQFELQIDYDIWYYIFQKLNSTIDQDSFSLTCSTFRHIQNSTSRKSLKIRCSNGDTIVDSFIINKLLSLSRHSKLETLTLSGCGCCRYCGHITDSCLTPLLKYGSTTLHSLYLDRCGSITNTRLTTLVASSACRLLCVISLANTRINDDGLKVLSESCKSLEELNLRSCKGISDHGIFYLYQNCRKLRALRIRGCPNIYGEGFRDCSPTLACLEAYHIINLEASMGVNHIVSGGGLEHLSLGYSFNIDDPLALTFLDPIGLGGFASKLEYLNIAGHRADDDDVIVKISIGCPLLQEWNLLGCLRIGISGWKSIGLYCQNLETLHVVYCDIHLCEKGLISIGAGCKRLSVLFIDEFSWNCHLDGVDDLSSLQREGLEIKFQVSLNDAPRWAFKTLEKFKADRQGEAGAVACERGHEKEHL